MRSNIYLRISLLILAVSISLYLLSYSHRKKADKDDGIGQEKCCRQDRDQSEFMLLQSLYRNLLSASR